MLSQSQMGKAHRNSRLRWRLPGSRGFEAIANEAICSATKIHLLHHVISVYVIIKMAAARTKAHCLVTRRNLLLLCEYY